MAKLVKAGSRLMFQVHYTPNGVAVKDRSAVGITFAKKPPRYVMFFGPAKQSLQPYWGKELANTAGTHFDPRCVEAFLRARIEVEALLCGS